MNTQTFCSPRPPTQSVGLSWIVTCADSKGSAQEGKSAITELCFFYCMLLPENISSSRGAKCRDCCAFVLILCQPPADEKSWSDNWCLILEYGKCTFFHFNPTWPTCIKFLVQIGCTCTADTHNMHQ